MEAAGVGRGHDIGEITAYLGLLGFLFATNKVNFLSVATYSPLKCLDGMGRL